MLESISLPSATSAAAVCAAELSGDALGSETLEFRPGTGPLAGAYHFDVAEAREGGSAGAAPLVLQTIALPLALADGDSTVRIKGGTHVPWSPSFDYVGHVWLETVRRLRVDATARLEAWGFYPAGGGALLATFAGRTAGEAIRPLSLAARGPIWPLLFRPSVTSTTTWLRASDRRSRLTAVASPSPIAVPSCSGGAKSSSLKN